MGTAPEKAFKQETGTQILKTQTKYQDAVELHCAGSPIDQSMVQTLTWGHTMCYTGTQGAMDPTNDSGQKQASQDGSALGIGRGI